MALSALASLAAPTFAAAITQVSTAEVSGLDVVMVTDDGAGSEIEVGRGLDPEPFVAVKSSNGANSAAVGCEEPGFDQVVCSGAFDAVVVFGNGGNDMISLDLITDGMPPLRAEAAGGSGDDTVKTPADSREVPQPETLLTGDPGNDTIEGGNGVDDLRGGEGNDTIRGFGGSDFFFGEEGDDSIDARDGAADQVDCGAGLDIADADAVDLLDATCEAIPLVPVEPKATPLTLAPPPLAFGPQTLVTLKLAAPRIPAAGPVRVLVANANGFAISGELSGKKKAAAGKKPATASRKQAAALKATPFSIGADAQATVKLDLPAGLRELLRVAGKLPLKLTAQVRDPAGNLRAVVQRVMPKLKQR